MFVESKIKFVLKQFSTKKVLEPYYMDSGASQAARGKESTCQRIHLPKQETQETYVQSLCWEDPLEKEIAMHSSILA